MGAVGGEEPTDNRQNNPDRVGDGDRGPVGAVAPLAKDDILLDDDRALPKADHRQDWRAVSIVLHLLDVFPWPSSFGELGGAVSRRYPGTCDRARPDQTRDRQRDEWKHHGTHQLPACGVAYWLVSVRHSPLAYDLSLKPQSRLLCCLVSCTAILVYADARTE